MALFRSLHSHISVGGVHHLGITIDTFHVWSPSFGFQHPYVSSTMHITIGIGGGEVLHAHVKVGQPLGPKTHVVFMGRPTI